MKMITLAAALLVFASPAARASSLGRSGYYKLPKDGVEFTPEPRVIIADRVTKPPQLLTVFQQSISDGDTLICGAASTMGRGTFTITSTNHPGNYENDEDCKYALTTEYPGDTITLTCQAFDVEDGSGCPWDYLEAGCQRFCGMNGPSGVSSQSTMTIRWHSDFTFVKTGYSCTVQVGPLDCEASHTLGRDTFSISSTNHPDNYENYEDCTYSLTTENPGDTITLTCQAFDVEPQSSCNYDYLNVEGQKYCGSEGPSDVSFQSAMTIIWHSDYSVVRTGYSCTVEVIPPTLSGCSCGQPNRASRIVGGVETEMNEYPWQVVVTNNAGSILCGGSVINNRYILTAAHCTDGNTANNTLVILRDHNIQTSDGEILRSVACIIEHPYYTSPFDSGYDFSLLELSEPIEFPSDNTIAPVCLPSDPSATYTGVDAIVSGWGLTSHGGNISDVLMEITVPVMSNTDCHATYSVINPSMICTSPECNMGPCQGDSGGPMVTVEDCSYTLIGVVSFGAICGDSPAVYGRVTEVLEWILDEASNGQYCAT